MDPSHTVIHNLKSIIARYGPPTESNISMYQGLMQDLLVDYPRELYLLKIILERGLVYRLLKENQNIPFETILQQMVTQLHTNNGIDKNAAKWAIETWADALGILTIQTCYVDFSCNQYEGNAPLSISFFNNSKGNISWFEWDFGDGKKSNEQNPSHVYTNTGIFSVTLRVSHLGSIEERKKDNIIVVKPNHHQKSVRDEIIQYQPENRDESYNGSNSALFEVKNNYTSINDQKKRLKQIGIVAISLICGIIILSFLFPGFINESNIEPSTNNNVNDNSHTNQSSNLVHSRKWNTYVYPNDQYENIEIQKLLITPKEIPKKQGEKIVFDIEMLLRSDSNGYTFNSNHFLDLSTDLDNPVWYYDIILNGVKNPHPGYFKKSMYIDGWVLSYEGQKEMVNIELEGKFPDLSKFPNNKTISGLNILLDKNDGGSRIPLVNIDFIKNN